MSLLTQNKADFGGEKFAVEYVEERPWERRLDFLMLNPSGEVPVLVGEAGTVSGHYAISEWLEEKGGATPLLPSSGLARAEVRRLSAWFDDKFYAEVGRLITYEKIDRRFMGADDGGGGPRYGDRARRFAQSRPAFGIFDLSFANPRLAGRGRIEPRRFYRRSASVLP